MNWMRVSWGRRLRTSWLLLGMAITLFPGCGRQDLYKPPKDSTYQAAGSLYLSAVCGDVYLMGNRAYVAGGQSGLFIIDVSNPAAPVLLSTSNTAKSAVAVAAVSVATSEGTAEYAFVADGTEGVAIFDVTRPDSVTSFTPLDTFDARRLSVDVSDRPSEPYTVFVSDSWRGLWQLDSVVGFPGSLFMSGRTFTRGAAQGVVVRDGFAYVADDETGVSVIDARVPVAMNVVSFCETDGNAQGIAMEGDYLFVADGKDGLVVLSIHGGDAPVSVAHLTLPGDCRAIVVREHQAFIAAYDGGLHIVDVSNPRDPRLLGTTITGKTTGVSVAANGLVAVSDEISGLILLGGGAAPTDNTPPGAVGTLAGAPRDSVSITLQWRAPGNDLFEGTASRYDLRYSTATITEDNWAEASPVADLPTPAATGKLERFVVTGLQPVTTYYFALKTADAVPNWSRLSNIASATTYAGNMPPTLANPTISPQGASPGSPITFQITYADPEGDIPNPAQVVISGTAHTMTAQGQDFVGGVVFEFAMSFDAGIYDHYFAFDDGRGHAVSTPVTPGPWIGNVVVIGSPANEPGRDSDEDQHLVLLRSNFWISDHEVTQAEWDSAAAIDPLLPQNPSRFGGPKRPVENVTWFDAVRYCNAKSTAKGLTPVYTFAAGDSVAWNLSADGYRLPTEAEWETACRGGTNTAFYNGPLTVQGCVDAAGSPDPNLAVMGWYCGNSNNVTHDVKTRQPSLFAGLELWDMHGNVWEWCWDWYSEHGVVGTPTGPDRGTQRVIRGGSWYYYARECRSASRSPYWPHSKDNVVGFRVAKNWP